LLAGVLNGLSALPAHFRLENVPEAYAAQKLGANPVRYAVYDFCTVL
jgi:hypothetical protein